jgi:hypothetical protein
MYITPKTSVSTRNSQQRINGSVCMSMCITQEKRDKELKKQFLKFTKVEDLRN